MWDSTERPSGSMQTFIALLAWRCSPAGPELDLGRWVLLW